MSKPSPITDDVEALRPLDEDELAGFYIQTDAKPVFVRFTPEERERYVLPRRWFRRKARIDWDRVRQGIRPKIRSLSKEESGDPLGWTFAIDFYFNGRYVCTRRMSGA